MRLEKSYCEGEDSGISVELECPDIVDGSKPYGYEADELMDALRTFALNLFGRCADIDSDIDAKDSGGDDYAVLPYLKCGELDIRRFGKYNKPPFEKPFHLSRIDIYPHRFQENMCSSSPYPLKELSVCYDMQKSERWQTVKYTFKGRLENIEKYLRVFAGKYEFTDITAIESTHKEEFAKLYDAAKEFNKKNEKQ